MCYISFKNSFSYRIEVIFSILSSIFYIITTITLWAYVYKEDMFKTNYMTSYVILVCIINIAYSNIICEIVSQKVIKGTIIIDLLKPVNFVWISYLEMLGIILSNLILKGLSIGIIFSPTLIRTIGKISFFQIFVFIITVIIGHIFYSIIYSIVSLLSFIFIEIWPLRRMIDDTIKLFSGILIPISMFPGKLKLLLLISPLRFLYYSPIEIIMGTYNYENIMKDIFSILIWLFSLIMILVYTYKKVINKCVIQGG